MNTFLRRTLRTLPLFRGIEGPRTQRKRRLWMLHSNSITRRLLTTALSIGGAIVITSASVNYVRLAKSG